MHQTQHCLHGNGNYQDGGVMDVLTEGYSLP